MTLRIVLAKPEEAPLVYRIMQEAFAEYVSTLEPPSSANRETLADVEQAMTKGGAILAWEGEVLVGSARFEQRLDYLYAGRVSVLPAHRGKGIASAMMKYLEEVARSKELMKIQVGVRMSLPDNVALYQGLSFEIVSTEAHPKSTNGEMTATLVKELK